MSEHHIPAEPRGPELRSPDLPRTMKERDGKALRSGWTTGSCASAAAKAATLALVTGAAPTEVEIALPGKDGRWTQRVTFAVERCELSAAGDRAQAVVVKDAGDDPDVTHGARLTATVGWRERPGLDLDGGEGVGVVTKPGLGLEVGAPAINPVPRAMIGRAVGEAADLEALAAAGRGLRVVISVPGGEVMARKTTNRRLGILGGISILGTTGIVRPFSTAAWRASVEQAVSVLAAQSAEEAVGAGAGVGSDSAAPAGPMVVLCTGGRTEKGAMALLPGLPEVSFVEVGDFTGAALQRAVEHEVRDVAFVGMAGKLAKLAAGVLMTHYTRSAVDMDVLAAVTERMGCPAELIDQVRAANTARHVYQIWEAAGVLDVCADAVCEQVAEVLERFAREHAGGSVRARVAMVDFTGMAVVGASRRWREARS
ncbi:MAG TPA: cobalt-precorrin-5B (C(1))-methyltransferase [Actinocrinis sp.]|nr:cobalt-precorrin-5B (C(1))-methyltransferase [Actinocrinis sp.]